MSEERMFDIVREIFEWVDVETTDSLPDGYSESQVERWRSLEYRDPSGHGVDHEGYWTCAPGVWSCRTCGKQFRTWRGAPEIDSRQGEVVAR